VSSLLSFLNKMTAAS